MKNVVVVSVRYISLLALAYWQGGLTFYALVVVPAGNRVFGGVEQGLVTQQVTNWLNLTGIGVLSVLLWDVVRWRRLSLAVTWLGMAGGQIALFFLHARMDRLLDPSTQEVRPGFYTQHEWYLVWSTLVWVMALAHAWFLLRDWRKQDSATE